MIFSKKKVRKLELPEYLKEANSRLKDYEFRTPKDGYLIHKYSYSPRLRSILSFFYKIVARVVEKIDENEKVNREILEEMELPPDTLIRNLDVFYKKEFRKNKYIYYFKSKPIQDLPEPEDRYIGFFPGKSKNKAKSTSVEFFKNFGESSSE